VGDFNNYADVQAALDEEYRAWRDGEITGFSQKGQEARDWWANQNSSSGGSSQDDQAPPATVQPKPNLPVFNPMPNTEKNFKVAPSDIIQKDSSIIDVAGIQQLLFEDIGSVELANISRADLVDGQSVEYSPIANLSTVNREFNPNNIIATSAAMDYFSRFGLDISSRGIHAPYFDSDGNLVIEIDSVNNGEEIQIEILSSGTINLVGDV
jgi:hypothetical protein